MGLDEFTVSNTRRATSPKRRARARALNTATWRVYPVDAPRPVTNPDFSSSSRGNGNPRGRRLAVSPRNALDSVFAGNYGRAAQRTGGKALLQFPTTLKNAIRAPSKIRK